jgi:hypothetical protein
LNDRGRIDRHPRSYRSRLRAITEKAKVWQVRATKERERSKRSKTRSWRNTNQTQPTLKELQMKRIIALVLSAMALSNVAFAQNADTQSNQQRDAFEVLTKYSPL